jgi:hypothetical protein
MIQIHIVKEFENNYYQALGYYSFHNKHIPFNICFNHSFDYFEEFYNPQNKPPNILTDSIKKERLRIITGYYRKLRETN